MFAALGLHPIVIEQHSDDCLEQLQQALDKRPQKLVAVGEIGLDLYRDDPQFDKQERLLEAQLKLAKRYELPVILHSRRTHDKLAMHLKRHALPRTGVVHGFSGSVQQAERFVQLGYKIGVGGTITYPRASKTREVMAQLPLDSLLLETDAPDMPLNGFQGQPNRPEQVVRVFDVLCELRRNLRMLSLMRCIAIRRRYLIFNCRTTDASHPAITGTAPGRSNYPPRARAIFAPVAPHPQAWRSASLSLRRTPRAHERHLAALVHHLNV